MWTIVGLLWRARKAVWAAKHQTQSDYAYGYVLFKKPIDISKRNITSQ